LAIQIYGFLQGSLTKEFECWLSILYLEDMSARLRIEVKSMRQGIRPSLYWQKAQEEQELHFAGTDGRHRSKPVKVVVNIVPKRY
jgi:hypothetical protein